METKEMTVEECIEKLAKDILQAHYYRAMSYLRKRMGKIYDIMKEIEEGEFDCKIQERVYEYLKEQNLKIEDVCNNQAYLGVNTEKAYESMRKGINCLLDDISYWEMQKSVYTYLLERYLEKKNVCNNSAEVDGYAQTIKNDLRKELEERMKNHNMDNRTLILDWQEELRHKTRKAIADKFRNLAMGVMKSRSFPYFLFYTTLVTHFGFWRGREESYIVGYLYNEEDIQQIEEAIPRPGGGDVFIIVHKMVSDLLKGKSGRPRENLNQIISKRSAIFKTYMITMKALKRLGFKSFTNMEQDDFARDAVPYLYDAFKLHQEVDLLVNKYQCVRILLDSLVKQKNYEFLDEDWRPGKPVKQIEKTFSEVYEEFLRHFKPEKLSKQESMGRKKGYIYSLFSKQIEEINQAKITKERLKEPGTKTIDTYHYIMIMAFMLSGGDMSPGVFYRFCGAAADTYINRSSTIGMGTRDVYYFNVVDSTIMKRYKSYLPEEAELVKEEFLKKELPQNVDESMLYGAIYQQLWNGLMNNEEYYSEEDKRLFDVIEKLDEDNPELYE